MRERVVLVLVLVLLVLFDGGTSARREMTDVAMPTRRDGMIAIGGRGVEAAHPHTKGAEKYIVAEDNKNQNVRLNSKTSSGHSAAQFL